MMEEDEGQNLLDERERKDTTQSVDLHSDNPIAVDISDALSERDKVKFTVHSKTTLPEYPAQEYSVVREHDEFIWLHDQYRENEDYAGIVIPPAPPKPDFDASREKLQKLSEGEGTMTKEEFQKMKQELEAEYLATFKKTVAMHEVFLCRLAAHPVLRMNYNFLVFLFHKDDFSVRSKNTKELLKGFAKGFAKGVDEKVLLSGHKDIDEHFEAEKRFFVDYFTKVKDAALKGDKVTASHKRMADTLIKISASLTALGTSETTKLDKTFNKASETFEKSRKIENRVASDEDLKLVDLLKYYMRDSEAAKDLLYRRMRCLANLESANRNLDKARAKGRDIKTCEDAQQKASEKFEAISETAKQELDELKKKKVQAFKKNLVELCELQLKHAKAQHQILKNAMNSLTEQA